jgi:RNA polymerase subunit RPABC4/transcription elongation factor Spt4
MTIHEVVALRCPSCGGGITQPSREMPFGAEFRCDHCSILSVLIIDRALVPLISLQKQGEKVCTACGRVAEREARFCQEGHPLVRACVHCQNEFAVDHERCDFCGKLQSAPRVCVHCHMEFAGDHEHCDFCGKLQSAPEWTARAKQLLAAGDELGAMILLRKHDPSLGLLEVKALVRSWANASATKPAAR